MLKNIDSALIDNPYFEQIESQILYPTKFQLNKTISFDTEAPFLDLDDHNK